MKVVICQVFIWTPDTAHKTIVSIPLLSNGMRPMPAKLEAPVWQTATSWAETKESNTSKRYFQHKSFAFPQVFEDFVTFEMFVIYI